MWEACRKFRKVWGVGGAQGVDLTSESNQQVTVAEELIGNHAPPIAGAVGEYPEHRDVRQTEGAGQQSQKCEG